MPFTVFYAHTIAIAYLPNQDQLNLCSHALDGVVRVSVGHGISAWSTVTMLHMSDLHGLTSGPSLVVYYVVNDKCFTRMIV